MDCAGLARIEGKSTATYCAVLDCQGEALFGIGDMAIHDCVTPQHVKQYEAEMANAPLVILDGNMPLDTINYVLDHCVSCKVPVWYEPTDIQKATKPWIAGKGQAVAFTSPNLYELRAICSYLRLGDIAMTLDNIEDLPNLLKQILTTAAPLLGTMSALMVTLGRRGFMIIRQTSPEGIDDPLLPSDAKSYVNKDQAEVTGLYFHEQNTQIVSVSGAGDCLAAGFICGMLQGKSVSECSALGIVAATHSLKASPAVPDTLSSNVLPWGSRQPFTLISC